jgi:glyoxylase-like metal-dependent hydrolase (beta-lactamase superfamily II)
MNTPVYEVYAIKYGHIPERRSAENFIHGDAHDRPMPIDFYIWAIVGTKTTYIVDTGFDPIIAAKRNRRLLRSPAVGLQALGIDANAVRDVILTHLHYDHAGNHELFPQARYHVQEREMSYCTGRCMCHAYLRAAYEASDVAQLVKRVFEGRVVFTDGEEEKAAGLSVHLVGGHTMGLQVVRVNTQRGWVVLASDAAHYYANIESGRPFPIAFNVAEMLQGFETVSRLASSPAHIVPGHDPLVLARYPPARPGLEGIAARLDVDPIAEQ